jgi:hypothetical protein
VVSDEPAAKESPQTGPQDWDDFIGQALDPEACFLCGSAVDGETRTREHVFPKWLLNRHGIWNARMTLLNGSLIPYSQLTVTCCKTCNGMHLSQLESEVASAFAGGPHHVRLLPEERLYLWLAKFYYGLVFRELNLAVDRRTNQGRTIVSDDILRGYAVHHLLLRRILGKVTWNTSPGSIFIFDAMDSTDSAATFDYFDAFDGPFVSIRTGSTFVAAFLQDFGAVPRLGVENSPQVRAARSVALHPFQCIELTAFFYTVLKLRERPPKFTVGKRDDKFDLMVLPQGGLSGRSPFADWDPELYANVFSEFVQTRIGVKLDVSHGTPSFLISSRGDPVQAPNVEWSPEVWDDPALLQEAGESGSG